MSLPQQQLIAQATNGQVFMLATNPNIPFSYFLHPRVINPQLIVPQLQSEVSQQPLQQPLQQNHEAEPILPPQPKPKPKNHTNVKLKALKEKCVSHFIDGQLIIETSRPLSDRKKKRKRLSSASLTEHPNQIQPVEHKAYQRPRIQSSVQATKLSRFDVPTAPTNAQFKQESKSLSELRADMANWSVNEVVRFIEQHEDIKEYSSKFAEDEIDGKALLLMIDRNLSFQVLTSMFKHGPAIKIEASLSKYKLDDR